MGVSALKSSQMDKEGERWAPPLFTQVGASGSSSPNSSPHPHPNLSLAFEVELTPSLPCSVRTAGQPLRLGWGSLRAAPLRAPAARDRSQEPPLLWLWRAEAALNWTKGGPV